MIIIEDGINNLETILTSLLLKNTRKINPKIKKKPDKIINHSERGKNHPIKLDTRKKTAEIEPEMISSRDKGLLSSIL